jgi:hypothetical protein
VTGRRKPKRNIESSLQKKAFEFSDDPEHYPDEDSNNGNAMA